MPVRDAGRARMFWPNIDVDGDGSATDDDNEGYVCITGNASWSGFKRQSIKTTCTESPADGWGNIIHTYIAGRFVELGTLTFDVDWAPAENDRVEAAFRNWQNRSYRIEFPPEVGESAGPTIVLYGHYTDFTPMIGFMAEGDEARSRATLVLKLSGDWTITDAVLV